MCEILVTAYISLFYRVHGGLGFRFVCRVLAWCARSPGFDPLHCVNQVWLCRLVILALRGGRLYNTLTQKEQVDFHLLHEKAN